jgi:hypothetical protein
MRFLKAWRGQNHSYAPLPSMPLMEQAAGNLASIITPRRVPESSPREVQKSTPREVKSILVGKSNRARGEFDFGNRPSLQRHLAVAVKQQKTGETISDTLQADPDDQMIIDYSEPAELAFDERLARMFAFVSHPPPPLDLWDTDDAQYLEKVACSCKIRLTTIDPKNGSFAGHMRFHWTMRTMNTQDRTRPRQRVPGVRLPSMLSNVDESRLWRTFEADSGTSILWQGTSLFNFSGHEVFEVQEFPFDRQVIDLRLFEFVWRDSKDTDVFYEQMNIVEFTVETISLLPEWITFDALIKPWEIFHPGSGPTFSTRFLVKLRLERQADYYITHIFFVSLLIMIASILPLAFEPGEGHIGDRLYLHAFGLLTLVAFKYVCSKELPSVPYSTFISSYMHGQTVTIGAVYVEAVFSYKAVHVYISRVILDSCEDLFLIALLIYWIGYFFFIAFGKQRQSWEEVLQDQTSDSDKQNAPSSYCDGTASAW